METVLDEAELLACFRQIDRDEVELAPDQRYPLVLDEALAWAVGPRAFLVFRDRPEARPRGIVFHRNPGSLPDVAARWGWCHAVRRYGDVKPMSVRADRRRRVGLCLCSDLSCVSPARELPTLDDLQERLSGDEPARRALRRISEFAARRLF